MLAQRVTSLAAWTGASQLISCRLIGYFLRVCLCLCRLPLTMPRGYRLLRFVHRAAHAVALVLFDKHPRTQGGLNQTCISFRGFFSETKCQGWSRGRGRGERAHWFNKRREDRWCSTTTKKIHRRKRLQKGNKSEEGLHQRQRIPLVESFYAPQLSDLASRKHLQM